MNFFVNNFLTNNELKFVKVTRGDDLDNICQGQGHWRLVPDYTK